jgi:hypothetical protein
MNVGRSLWILLAVLPLLCGCPDSRRKHYKPRPETPEEAAFRKSTEDSIAKTASLKVTWAGPIPDGGSWVFRFIGDSGLSFDLLFLHGREDWGGSPDFQVIRICDAGGRIECDVRERSSLEGHLIRLMNSAEIAPNSDTAEYLKPTREQLKWLVASTANRRLRNPVPRAK